MFATTRRGFMQNTAAGTAALGMANLGFLSQLPAVSAAETDVSAVRFHDDIEPIVKLLEQTPREQLLEEVASRIQSGRLSYREVLAALQLAGIRNIQPRPSVGFKFHAVLVVNSAHLASISGPDEHRWLPIFWALDNFKESQAADTREGDWTMPPANESAVPAASQSRQAWISAMDAWDEGAADAAMAGLARSAGANEIFELLYKYGARDFRSIGHKAIYVANARRTLECIGWQHAEPVLRSLTYALLMHDGENPAKSDQAADRHGRLNAELAPTLRDGWQQGTVENAATLSMLESLRQGTPEECSRQAVQIINGGAGAQAVWDALYLMSCELVMRQPAIVPLHAVTTCNALRYAYLHAGDDVNRRLLLLQNVAFVAAFREAAQNRGTLRDARIDDLQPVAASGAEAVGEIFAELSGDRQGAAQKTLQYLDQSGDAKALIDAARLQVFLKGSNAHDYKYSSALLEDYYQVSPAWRNRCLAAGTFLLRGAADSDNQLVQRTRAALT